MSDERDTIESGPPALLPKTAPPPPPSADEAQAVSLDSQMTTLIGIMSRVEGKVDAVHAAITTLTNEQQKIKARQARAEKRIGKLEKEVARLKTMLPPPPNSGAGADG